MRRQDGGEESADEFLRRQPHCLFRLLFSFFPVVLVGEDDDAIVNTLDAVVGDGDAVDVAAEIAQQVLGLGERALGVDHPVVTVERGSRLFPTGYGSQLGLSAKIELAFVFERFEGLDVFLPKYPREGLDREQEVLRRAHESAAVVLQRPAGNDAVHVRVSVEGLPPGMEHHDNAELGVPAVLGKALQGLGGDLEQQAVDPLGVVAGQPQEHLRQGEDDVEVLDRQQLQLSGVDPGAALAGPAFWAVAITIRVVADLVVAAAVALVDVGAHCVGAALVDGRHGLVLRVTEIVAGAVGGSVLPEDVGDFKRRIGGLRGELPVDLVGCRTLLAHSCGCNPK